MEETFYNMSIKNSKLNYYYYYQGPSTEDCRHLFLFVSHHGLLSLIEPIVKWIKAMEIITVGALNTENMDS